MVARLTSMNPTERHLAFREVLGLPNPNEAQNEAGETAAEREDYIDVLRAEIESLRPSATRESGLREAAEIAESAHWSDIGNAGKNIAALIRSRIP